jgi:hypothetical protein
VIADRKKSGKAAGVVRWNSFHKKSTPDKKTDRKEADTNGAGGAAGVGAGGGVEGGAGVGVEGVGGAGVGEVEENAVDLSACCKPIGPLIAAEMTNRNIVIRKGSALNAVGGALLLLVCILLLYEFIVLAKGRCSDGAMHLSLWFVGIAALVFTTSHVLSPARAGGSTLQWHVHVHHYAFCGLLAPLLLNTMGSSAWRSVR